MEKPEDMELEIPDYLGALRMFRAFDVNAEGRLMSPYARGYRWKPGENQASCAYQGADLVGVPAELALTCPEDRIKPDELVGYREHLDIAPDPDCRCGFYGHLGITALKSITYTDFGRLLVYGACEAWGRVEVHQGGIRAQYAKITHLALSPFLQRAIQDDREVWGLSDRLEQLLNYYQVPLIEFEELYRLKRSELKSA